MQSHLHPRRQQGTVVPALGALGFRFPSNPSHLHPISSSIFNSLCRSTLTLFLFLVAVLFHHLYSHHHHNVRGHFRHTPSSSTPYNHNPRPLTAARKSIESSRERLRYIQSPLRLVATLPILLPFVSEQPLHNIRCPTSAALSTQYYSTSSFAR